MSRIVRLPPPGPDEVQIAARPIGLNRAEVIFRRNAYLQQARLPSRLGYREGEDHLAAVVLFRSSV